MTFLWKLKSHYSDFPAPRTVLLVFCRLVRKEQFESAWSAGETQGCISVLRKSGSRVLGVSYPCEIERLQDLLPSIPGSCKLLPFTEEYLPVGDLLNQHSKISHQAGVRGGTTIHRGKVLTFVEWSSSLLAATTKFSMKQTLGTPKLPGTTSSC